jgi:hypothetical protein
MKPKLCNWCLGRGATVSSTDLVGKRRMFHKGCRESFREWLGSLKEECSHFKGRVR